MISCATRSVGETRSLGAALASVATPGDLISLSGDLGAGKTAFVQGFAAALGVAQPVTSPTFVLANRYEGRIVVNHLDAYRLSGVGEAHDLALPELIDDGVTLVEWGDAISAALPADRLEIAIGFGTGPDDRSVALTARGPAWLERRAALDRAVQAWQVPLGAAGASAEPESARAAGPAAERVPVGAAGPATEPESAGPAGTMAEPELAC